MAKSPAVILFDSNGQAMAVADGVAIAVGTQALLAAGTDGTNAKVFLLDASGRQILVGAGAAGAPAGGVLTIQGASGGTPISVSGSISSPGAATETTLATRLSDAAFTGRINTQGQKAMAASTPVVLASDQSVVPVSGSVSVSNLPATQAVSASALPLPTGAASEASLATRASEATLSALNTKIQTGTVKTDGSATTQPVSGSVSVSNLPATQAVSATSLPLPSGAATAAKQPALGTAGTPSSDVLTVQGAASMTALKVDGSAATQPVSGSITVSNFPATQAVSAGALPLPSGAATETTLAAISTKTPTVGQKAMAASSPVVLASDQSSIPVAATISGTPNVAVSNFPATQAVSGSVSVSNFPATQAVSAASLPLPTGAAADSTLTGGTQKAIARGGAKGATTAADVTSTVSGANHQALDVVIYDVSGNPITSFGGPGSVTVSNFPATQPVSATSLPLPSGAATAVKQPALGTAGTPSSDVLTVQGAASMTALKVDGSATTQPVSAAALPLPSGASTAAKQPALGTAGTPSTDVLTVQGAASMTALKVDGSATTQPISGSVSVSNFPATQPVSATSLPLPSGAATSAAQTTGNASLSSIDTKVTGLSLDTTLTGGAQKAIARGGAKGTTTAADVTSTASGVNHNALDVVIYDTAGNPITSFTGGTNNQGTPNTAANAWPIKISDGLSTAAVKAASTAAVAADPALVVAWSPNNSVAVTGSVSVSNFPASQTVSGAVSVSNFPATQPVSATSLPLPTGAATAAKQPALGAAGTASIDVLTVQGITSMTPLKVDGSGATQPVSGSVSVSNFPATQPVSGTVSVTGVATSALQTTGNTSLGNLDAKTPALGQATMANSRPVVIASNQPALAVTSADAVTTGSIANNGDTVATGTLNGQGSLTIQIVGTWTGSIAFETSSDGSSYFTATARSITGTTDILSTTTGGLFRAFGVAGMQTYRVRATAWSSGTANITIRASQATSVVTVIGALPTGVNTIGAVNQGSSAILGNAWAAKLTDGTNGPVAIKGASTAAAAADPALVVAVSPNTTVAVAAASLPLPSGAATAAKQPALGTAGTPASDVLTVQGSASMTPLKVDGSGTTQPIIGSVSVSNLPASMAVSGSVSVSNFPATQPVSGTVTANIGTSGALALDATLTGGSQKSILRGGAKGSTTAADVTSLATGTNHQALVVALVDAFGNQLTNFGSPVTSTTSVTSVVGNAASVQFLASNTARVGATIYNDSTAVLYVKLGTTASASSFSVKMLANGYYEVPFGYTGRIDGIWASATGNARITELS